MWSSPCRRIPLLSIAHPVEGKFFSGAEGLPGDGIHPGLNGKEGKIMAFFVFCKILDSYPVFCYVKEKSNNKTHLNCSIQFDRFFLDFYGAFIMLRPL